MQLFLCHLKSTPLYEKRNYLRKKLVHTIHMTLIVEIIYPIIQESKKDQ